MDAGFALGFLFVYFLIYMGATALLIVGQILIGVAINRDATALGLSQGKMFMILTIFFGGIPAGIYFIIRSNKILSEGDTDFTPSAKKAKAGITLYIIGTVLLTLMIMGYFELIMSLAMMSM